MMTLQKKHQKKDSDPFSWFCMGGVDLLPVILGGVDLLFVILVVVMKGSWPSPIVYGLQSDKHEEENQWPECWALKAQSAMEGYIENVVKPLSSWSMKFAFLPHLAATLETGPTFIYVLGCIMPYQRKPSKHHFGEGSFCASVNSSQILECPKWKEVIWQVFICPNWNDTEKISMAPAQGWRCKKRLQQKRFPFSWFCIADDRWCWFAFCHLGGCDGCDNETFV